MASSPSQSRRGPAPFASFDHDVTDESSPESKQTVQLPEIREDPCTSTSSAAILTVPEVRQRSASSPAVSGLPAPRIDISRASSSSQQDSRDSSPELALFAGTEDKTRLDTGFREDGAEDLRSSTEELSFLDTGDTPVKPIIVQEPPSNNPRRHSRKDSQSSEIALLGLGRTSRVSSVGSQCSALSAFSASRVSRLSVVSGMERSPSPHKMLLETSFCGPKPIETDPETCVAECFLEITKKTVEKNVAPEITNLLNGILPARNEVTTQVEIEHQPPHIPSQQKNPSPVDEEKRLKEEKNRARAEDRKARSRERRDPSFDKPEVYKSRNRSKDIIRIKLNPDSQGDDDEDNDENDAEVAATSNAARKPVFLELTTTHSRTPSPSAAAHSRKSSFCSLFKSRETIASPESPAGALRRKKSLTEGRSKSRERSSSRGSVFSLFRGSRRSATASPVPDVSRPSSIIPTAPSIPPPLGADKLKYYEPAPDGIIHIPLHSPPEERHCQRPASAAACMERTPITPTTLTTTTTIATTATHSSVTSAKSTPKILTRTVLPDGSIIIPLRSPTEKTSEDTIESIYLPSTSKESPKNTTTVMIEQAVVEKKTKPSEKPPDIVKDIQCEEKKTSIIETTPVKDAQTNISSTETSKKRREKLVFTTNVGSREQIFSTQFSITKTPSVTSEISGSFANFAENFEPEQQITQVPLRDTHIASIDASSPKSINSPKENTKHQSKVNTPCSTRNSLEEPVREDVRPDSSGSEPSSEAAGGRHAGIGEIIAVSVGEDAEKRGLVLGQESFEELPYIPTTLPQERPVGLPIVPVKERGGINVASVERPRPSAQPPGPPRAPITRAVMPESTEKIRISLPRRQRASSASYQPKPERSRTRSGSASKVEWIDFEDVPEKRKQPKRIQTIPTTAAAAEDVVYSYVEPEHCRCECHAATKRDDETPLLQDTPTDSSARISSPEEAKVDLSIQMGRPFTADFDIRHDEPADSSGKHGAVRRH